jgi:hypothetical protein
MAELKMCAAPSGVGIAPGQRNPPAAINDHINPKLSVRSRTLSQK